ncbi:MAG: threonine ammonia-lyase, partial [Bosea sp. (in: a-proteobacteria)]
TASFKERGAANRLLQLNADERRRGVIAMSAGNHAQAVAWHAHRLGVPAVIVMPETTPMVKVENTRHHGAEVVLAGETLVESTTEAVRLASARGLVFVHPFDDAQVMAGQGTVALEMLADAPDLDVLIVPVGGGGLISGIASAATAINPAIEIVGVEAAMFPAARNWLTGESAPVGGPTLAEGIAVKHPGKLTLPVIARHVSGITLVREELIERAVNAFATLQHNLAEGAGAAGLAAMLEEPARYKGRKVGLVLCGGNIDARLLAAIMVRELEREDHIASFRITAHDRPGFLGRISTRLGELGANILEVSHGRLFLDVPAKGVSLDVTIETRGGDHSRAILLALEAEGFAPQRLDPRGVAVGQASQEKR